MSDWDIKRAPIGKRQMRVVLSVEDGPFAGRKILLQSGQRYQVGRTEWSDLAVPHDPQMSATHFAVRCELEACHLADLQSTNGTRVNGLRVAEALLQDGDTILAGRTVFRVQIQRQSAVVAQDESAESRPPADTAATDVGGGIAKNAPAPGEADRSASPGSDPDPDALRSAEPADAAETADGAQPGRPDRPWDVVGVPAPYQQALLDAVPRVRRQALLAAVWTRQSWLLEMCRRQAAEPSSDRLDALWLLAVLGGPGDCRRIRKIGQHRQLGIRRFAVLASFGHPAVVADLLEAIGGADREAGAAAAEAYAKITGQDLELDDVGSASGEAEAASGAAFGMRRAKERWEQIRKDFAADSRWRRGVDLSSPGTPEVLSRLDMEGRWEALLRARYEGRWNGWPQDIERLRYVRPGAAFGGHRIGQGAV